MVFESVRKHNKCIIVTEEPIFNTFAQGLAGRVSKVCFEDLDAPVEVIGSVNTPAIPLNSALEAELLPNARYLPIPNRDHMRATGDKAFIAGVLEFLGSPAD